LKKKSALARNAELLAERQLVPEPQGAGSFFLQEPDNVGPEPLNMHVLMIEFCALYAKG
jgi:hypothetical protein